MIDNTRNINYEDARGGGIQARAARQFLVAAGLFVAVMGITAECLPLFPVGFGQDLTVGLNAAVLLAIVPVTMAWKAVDEKQSTLYTGGILIGWLILRLLLRVSGISNWNGSEAPFIALAPWMIVIALYSYVLAPLAYRAFHETGTSRNRALGALAGASLVPALPYGLKALKMIQTLWIVGSGDGASNVLTIDRVVYALVLALISCWCIHRADFSVHPWRTSAPRAFIWAVAITWAIAYLADK